MDSQGVGAVNPRLRDPGQAGWRAAQSAADRRKMRVCLRRRWAWCRSTSGLAGARYLELIGEPERYFVEQPGQRGTIGLGVLQLLRPVFEQSDELFALIADSVGQFFGLLEKIVADFALCLRFVIFDLADFFQN